MVCPSAVVVKWRLVWRIWRGRLSPAAAAQVRTSGTTVGKSQDGFRVNEAAPSSTPQKIGRGCTRAAVALTRALGSGAASVHYERLHAMSPGTSKLTRGRFKGLNGCVCAARRLRRHRKNTRRSLLAYGKLCLMRLVSLAAETESNSALE